MEKRINSKAFAIWERFRGPVARSERADASRYRLAGLRILLHRTLTLLPPHHREWMAERLFRRTGAPGPAAEHVLQYLLSAGKPGHPGRKREEATVARGADKFYDKQYRQSLNPVMGAFAMTATQVLLASGAKPQGWLWGRHRRVFAALLEQHAEATPILVLDDQTVAVPLWLPQPESGRDHEAVLRWLAGRGSMPAIYREFVLGEAVRSADRPISARERSGEGALLEVITGVLASRKLALLALHPHDPDAMGLHITLFGVELLGPEQLERDYGPEPTVLDAYRDASEWMNRRLVFAVGGTEEVFTQCSQNLFVKRPEGESARQPIPPHAWNPALPLERLLRTQFETIQATVSASGLPGASPRNGDLGKAAFVGRVGRRIVLLIPYHPGNAVHGHAAKLWSNPYGAVVISDDHHALSRITVSGPARVISHVRVQREFPDIASQLTTECGRNGTPVPDPEYWFLQEVADLVQERGVLPANTLDPVRATCSISAGGQARHSKKPAYFAADTLPRYDQHRQHAREEAGRPVDPAGTRCRAWLETVGDALMARRAHLQGLSHPQEVEQ